MRLDISDLVFSIHQNFKEVDSVASEGMNLPGRVRASRQREQASFFHVLYVGIQQKVWKILRFSTQKICVKGVCSHFKYPGQKWVFMLQMIHLRKNPSQVCPPFGFQSIPDVLKWKTKNSHDTKHVKDLYNESFKPLKREIMTLENGRTSHDHEFVELIL